MRRILTIAAGICLSALALTGASAASKPVLHLTPADVIRQSGSVVYSTNWAGYVATPKSGGAKGFKYITATYTVPTLKCSPTDQNGDFQGTVLSDGVSAHPEYETAVIGVCQEGNSPYYASWYEGEQGTNEPFTVSPGDQIFSSVYYAAGVATLKLTDLTTGQGFSITQTVAVTVLDAAVLSEAVNDGVADFGTEHFDSIKVTDTAGQHGGLSSSHWGTDEVISEDSSHEITVQPGTLYASTSPPQSAFKTTWLREN